MSLELPPDSAASTQVTPDEGQTTAADLLPQRSLFDDDLDTPQRTGITWMVASGLVLVLGVGGWLGYRNWQSRQVEPPTVSTEAVTRRTLEERVDASGLVSLGNQQTLKAPGEVTVEAVLVSERQRVAQGDVLLRLRNRGLERQLDEQLIDTDILGLQAQRHQEVLRERQRDVERAEERLAESKTLLERGFISEDAYDVDRDALEAAQSALREAQVDQQQTDLEIRKNQAIVANLRAQITDNAIVAPFDAVVLNIDVQPGQGLTNDGVLLTLGDPNQEVIIFDLMPLDANRVSVNMPVRVSIIGPNPQPYAGRVVSIAPQAVGGSEGNRDSQATVRTVAQLERPSGTLIPGSAVSVEVVLVQRPEALAIPVEALQQDGETPYVWVVNSQNVVEKRPVVTGLNTLESLEITAGLTENETIILNAPPDQPLTEGMTVIPSAARSPTFPDAEPLE